MSPLQGQTIGFVGLGLMGKPMCRNLQDAGAELIVHNRSRGAMDELAGEGMTPAGAPRDVAARCEIVIINVTDTPAVEAVLFGAGGLIDGLRPGSLVIDMGTTGIDETRRFAQMIRQGGADYIDAPVSGGQVGAEAGNLSIMVGASTVAFAMARPIFDVLGERVTHVGDVGAGQVTKAANQVIVGLTIGAVAEGLALARAAGVDPARVRDALVGGFASSRILELHGRRMVDGDFAPGGRATVQLKDMRQALDLADGLDLELPATRLNRDLYERLVEAGLGDLDHSALYKLYGEEE